VHKASILIKVTVLVRNKVPMNVITASKSWMQHEYGLWRRKCRTDPNGLMEMGVARSILAEIVGQREGRHR